MAFLGVPVVKQIADNLVRITGVHLNNGAFGFGATGTVGLFGSTLAPDIVLPAAFRPRPYDLPDAAPAVSLQDSISVELVYTNPGAAIQPVEIVKTGTTAADFAITFTDTVAAVIPPEPPLPPTDPTSTGDLEIYIKFH